MVPKSQIESIPEGKKVVFISYSWDSDEHKAWVRKFADDLGREYGIHVLLDQYCRYGENLITFMQDGIERSDRVLIIGTPRYKQRIEQNRGGAKFEEQIISSELYENINTPKYIPIFREGENVASAFKGLLRSHIGADFRDDSHYEENLKKVAYDILDKPLNARPEAKEKEQKAEKVDVKPKVDPIEEREHPSLWEKLFQFEQLSNDELKSVVAEACRLIREGETTTSFVEYTVAVVNLCAIDEEIPIADEDWKNIIAYLLKYIETCPNKEELFERKRNFQGAIELVGYKTKGRRLQNIIGQFRQRYDLLWEKRKDKMTLFLENMTDDTMGELYEVYNGAVPDHTTPYDMKGIFQNVDVDKLYVAISHLSNASRKRFINFIEDRYLLRHQLPGNSWVAFDEELPNLRSLKQNVEDNIGLFELNDKRSMKQLGEYIGMAIRRCCGERGVLVRN